MEDITKEMLEEALVPSPDFDIFEITEIEDFLDSISKEMITEANLLDSTNLLERNKQQPYPSLMQDTSKTLEELQEGYTHQLINSKYDECVTSSVLESYNEKINEMDNETKEDDNEKNYKKK